MRFRPLNLRRILALALAATAAMLALAFPGMAFAGSVTVSLTFDDGWDSQQTAATMLATHGLNGTFYVNSPKIDQPGYLTWSQLATFNAAGNEIGGHTLTHPDLTTLTSAQAQTEICQDRQNIQAHGFVVPDFAYPGGAYDSNTGAGPLDVSSIVRGCGYSSGRGAFGLHNITATNDTRAYATSILPPNLLKILIPCCINYAAFGGSTPTAAALEGYVQHAQTEASPNPGWVIFFFHRICDACSGDDPAPSISPGEFDAFLDWLTSGSSGGVTVKTVAQVVKGDAQPPTTAISCGGAACSSGWYGNPVSVSLSGSDSGASGLFATHYTTDGSEPTVASPLYAGPFTIPATTTVKFRSWDNAGNVEATKSQTIQLDTAAPSSSIACNASACSGWYAPGVSLSLSASDAESGVAAIHYTTDGSDPTLASPTYSAPFTLSGTSTVKYRAWDNAGNAEQVETQTVEVDRTAPVSSISCDGAPCSASAYSAAVTVALSASDDESGVSAIRYTTDGSDPTASSTAYSGPFTISTTTTVKYRAWDNVGNVEAAKTQVVTITVIVADATPPVSSITCNLAFCSTGWYSAAVSVALSASDTGSGVASVHYTTNGSDPTSASPTYSAPFTVSATTTVKYRAWDNAGNVEPTNTQLIRIDAVAPTVAITSPANGSSVTGNVKLSATGTDNGGGSGIAQVSFYADGRLVATTTSTTKGVYSVSWNTKKVTKGQHSLTAIATDAAGNAQTSTAVAVAVR